MKKKFKDREVLSGNFPRQLFFIMKLTLFILITSTLGLFATGSYSQNTRITLDLRSVPVREALKAIENESEFFFIYNNELINVDRKININVKDQKITEVLNNIFEGRDVEITVIDRKIVLAPAFMGEQQPGKRITGKVTDSSGATLPGVSVVVKGTNTGIITDADGQFRLSVPADAKTLVFSFVGMKSQEIAIGSKTTINLVMLEETIGIDEVVAIGYGTQKKINLTGAVSNVTSQVLESRPITNLGQGLQGTVSNLNVTQNSGSLGKGASFNIRGATSINGGEPLILVNGVPMDINMINPSDIDNVTVLKDGASSAIYGARAAFGVILVTTKSGKKRDKPTISLSSNYSVNMPVTKLEIMNSMEMMGFYNEASMRQSGSPYYAFDQYYAAAITAHFNDPSKPSVFEHPFGDPNAWEFSGNVNWPRELLRDSYPMQQHTASISGGSDKFDYYTSFGYFNQEGNPKHFKERYNRYNFSTSLNYDIAKWLRIGTKIAINNSNKKYPPRDAWDGNWNENATNFHLQSWPMTPIYLPDGNYAVDGGYGVNVVQTEEQGGYRTRDNSESWLTGLVKLTPVKHMTFNMDYSFNISNTRDLDYRRLIPVYGNKGQIYTYYKATNPSNVTRRSNDGRYYAFNAYADYENTFNKKHYFKAMVGFNQENSSSSYFDAKRENLIVETMPFMSQASGQQYVSDAASEYAIRGAFSRLNYSFDNRYLIELNGRYDGTSKFPSKDRFAFFPSASVGWRIDNEGFFAGLKHSINLLKFRGSYSNLGNQSVSGNYPYIATFGSGTVGYLINGALPMTVTAPGLVSPTLTWETVTQRDLGIDFAVLDSRLTGTFDVYRRDTKNMLTRSQTLPAVLAVAEPQSNAADMKTTGFDLTLSWNHSINKLKYGITFILSDNNSVITKFSNPSGIISDYYVGRKMGEIWGFETGGFFKTDAEATALNQTEISGRARQAGDIWFKDLNGDGKITYGNGTLADHGDRKIIGNSAAHYSFGFKPNVSWNGFDLEIFLQGVAKRDAVLDPVLFFGPYYDEWQVPNKVLTDYWTPENPNAYFPRPLLNTGADVLVTQTHFLQNAAYMRLKQLTFGYTIPVNLSKKLGIDRLRIYFSGNNLLTVTNMIKIADPEQADFVGSQGVGGALSYPLNKSFSMGVNIDF
ncbi:MAG: TonB-dependent receptor [Prolixibacteraceae bacterium]|jgi:TonB-linked SusC/RagA family outer membrane protein|nr:TonB-dependent receptor [Prolixibacteraceae bacterium]